jgi:hypothetical protein
MITIILPVSRLTYINRVFDCLNKLECNPEEMSILTYVDADLNTYDKVMNLTGTSKFKNRRCVFRNKGQTNVSHVIRRRERISAIHNEIRSKYLGETDYVFLIEDDTIFPPDTLNKLLQTYSSTPFTGFVSGVQLGRWGYLHIGAWEIDDVNDPSTISTVGLAKGIRNIDTAGLYCCLTSKDSYMKAVFEPFGKILGPDFTFGLSLRRLGLYNYIDYSIQCDHLTERGDITFKDSKIQVVEFRKSEESRTGWSFGEI